MEGKFKKIWLQKYRINSWDIKEIDSENFEEIPEALVFELLGAKKTILFTEGDKDSWDYKIYSRLFPQFKVVPVGGCSRVIEFTKSFNQSSLIINNAKGIVDKDQRDQDQVDYFRSIPIFTINLNEIENIFVHRDILEIVFQYSDLVSNDELKGKISLKKDILEMLKIINNKGLYKRASSKLGLNSRIKSIGDVVVNHLDKENLKSKIIDVLGLEDLKV